MRLYSGECCGQRNKRFAVAGRGRMGDCEFEFEFQFGHRSRNWQFAAASARLYASRSERKSAHYLLSFVSSVQRRL